MSPTFAQLGVPDAICRALASRGIDEPFPIQTATIADALAGRDVCGRAPTGSGKTIAFGIPLVANVSHAEPKQPRGLVLAPTRELADQIASELRTFAGDVRIGVVYGGVGYPKQLQQLRRGVDVLVACPGRLEDLLEQRALDLSRVDQVVVDEADRMADMGFLPAVRRILDQTAADRQTVLFSATLDGEVAKLTQRYQADPVTHEVGDITPDITAAEHRFLTVDRTERVDTTAGFIGEVGQAIVFCRTRHGSDRVARQLNQRGVTAAAIHGGHAQNRRTKSLARFTNGAIQALVATDVAARGIHVDDVAAVVHFDPPADHKTYIHRSGRTARAGRNGIVLSLVQPDQVGDIRQMTRQLGLDAPVGGDAPDRSAKQPSGPRRGGRPGGKRNGHSGSGRQESNKNGSARPPGRRSRNRRGKRPAASTGSGRGKRA